MVAKECCASALCSQAIKDSAPSVAGVFVAAVYMMRAIHVDGNAVPYESAPVFVTAAATSERGATTSGYEPDLPDADPTISDR